MRRSLLSLFAFALLAAGCENVQAPGDDLALQTRNALDVLPAGVETVGMMNLDEARGSDAFDLVSGGELSLDRLQGELGARFDDFIAATGFNPEENLHRVYFGAATDPGRGDAPYFVAYADYDRARLDAYIDDQPDLDLERSTYAGVPVYTSLESEDGGLAFALVNDDMIVASASAGVRDMLDRIQSGTPGLSSDAEMMALIGRAGFPDDMWIAVRGFEPSSDDTNPFGQTGRMMDDLVLSVGFERDGVGLKATGMTRAGTDAADVADLVRGTVATMKMSVKADDAMLDALDRVKVREVRGGVEVDVFLTDAALRSMRSQGDA
ncbi:MAG: hypothetical protein AAGI91_03780 [Bacteroidota bacterium]